LTFDDYEDDSDSESEDYSDEERAAIEQEHWSGLDWEDSSVSDLNDDMDWDAVYDIYDGFEDLESIWLAEWS
jgi:hypothetical protein